MVSIGQYISFGLEGVIGYIDDNGHWHKSGMITVSNDSINKDTLELLLELSVKQREP